ncbi:MAG: radical SAM protein [Bdellovibrionales bacterium]|nr:radical SAM protein [Bdellovibrionales bacterium]
MNTFQPDLIIEVTGACNRACAGCYAPNVVAKDASEVFEKRPELFLKSSALNNALSEITSSVGIAAIRGGEPTLHPEIANLLKNAATHAEHVFLETHGRWLMEENFVPYVELLNAVIDNGIIVKISFDKMHGLKADELQRIVHFLNWHDVDYRIAITEPTLADYMATRSLCSFVKDEKIIYQAKALSADELVKPTIGTINVRGELKATLTHKFNLTQELSVAYA